MKPNGEKMVWCTQETMVWCTQKCPTRMHVCRLGDQLKGVYHSPAVTVAIDVVVTRFYSFYKPRPARCLFDCLSCREQTARISVRPPHSALFIAKGGLVRGRTQVQTSYLSPSPRRCAGCRFRLVIYRHHDEGLPVRSCHWSVAVMCEAKDTRRLPPTRQ